MGAVNEWTGGWIWSYFINKNIWVFLINKKEDMIFVN